MEFKILEFNFLFDFYTNNINILIIENKKYFRNLCLNLLNDLENYDKFLLTKNKCDKLDTTKFVFIINNIFELDINKIFLNKLYKNLEKDSNNFFIQEKIKLYNEINKYILNLTSDYHYDFNVSNTLNILDIFKSINLKINIENDLLWNLLNYLKISNEIYGYEIFIIFNLKNIFSINEVKEIYKFCEYNNLKLLLIETYHSYSLEEYEKIYTIDNDLCDIY